MGSQTLTEMHLRPVEVDVLPLQGQPLRCPATTQTKEQHQIPVEPIFTTANQECQDPPKLASRVSRWDPARLLFDRDVPKVLGVEFADRVEMPLQGGRLQLTGNL